MKEKILSFDTKYQNIFFTSDTHFWHENIIKFCNRPFSSIEEMNDTIIENWNKVVGENDIVFHLGDFCFCGSDKFKEIIEKLNGRIYLILGNHDWKTIKNWHASKFEGVYQQLGIKVNGKKIYLNHFPFLCYAGTYRKFEDTVWQLFGHVHICKIRNTGKDFERMNYLFPTQYDVGVDFNDYTPISFKEVKEKIEFQVANNVNLMYWVKS